MLVAQVLTSTTRSGNSGSTAEFRVESLTCLSKPDTVRPARWAHYTPESTILQLGLHSPSLDARSFDLILTFWIDFDLMQTKSIYVFRCNMTREARFGLHFAGIMRQKPIPDFWVIWRRTKSNKSWDHGSIVFKNKFVRARNCIASPYCMGQCGLVSRHRSVTWPDSKISWISKVTLWSKLR